MQLKALLTEHKLSTSGLKADLIDRLHRYALEVQAGPESTDAGNADNGGQAETNYTNAAQQSHIEVTASSPGLIWGQLRGYENVKAAIENAYAEITKWQRNIFEVPRGKSGQRFISEAIRLLQLFNNKTSWEPLAIQCLNIFLPIILQKPSAKSKANDHVRYLTKRLKLWEEGKLKELMSECKEIQKRLSVSKRKTSESATRGFARLMMLGKVRQALKLIDANSDITGTHELSNEIRISLQAKHPKGEPLQHHVLVQRENTEVEEVIFEEVNVDRVKRAARNTFGSGGPTKIAADIWKKTLML